MAVRFTREETQQMVNQMGSSIVCSTRRVGLKMVKTCISGKDVATWMTIRQLVPRHLNANDKMKTIDTFGQDLISQGVIIPTSHKAAVFVASDNYLYSFPLAASNTKGGGSMGARSGSLRRSLELFSRSGSGQQTSSSQNQTAPTEERKTGLRRSLEIVGLRKPAIPSSPTTPVSSPELEEEEQDRPNPNSNKKRSSNILQRSLSAMDEDDDDDDDFLNEELDSDNTLRSGSSQNQSKDHLGPRSASVNGKLARPTSKIVTKMKKERELKVLLKENTERNRSPQGVFDILEFLALGGKDALEMPNAKTTTHRPALVSSQFFDKSTMNKLFQDTGIKLSFNEKVYLRRLDEDHNFIEDVRVPIDYTIKDKLEQTALEFRLILGGEGEEEGEGAEGAGDGGTNK